MTTKQLLTQIDVYLRPTSDHQYALTVERRFLVQLHAHLEMMEVLVVTSPQPATEQTEHIVLAVAEND